MYANLPIRTDINLPTFADWLHFWGGDAPPPPPPTPTPPPHTHTHNHTPPPPARYGPERTAYPETSENNFFELVRKF